MCRRGIALLTVPGALTAAALLVPVPATAQSPFADRVAVEAVAAVTTSSSAFDDPFVFLDGTATVRIGQGFDAVVRPYGRRLPGGDWSAEMYQLQLRYQSRTRVPFRVDAGIISSPIGLGTLELRQDRNPTISAPFYYFSPLPRFDARPDRVQLISGGYPVGAVVSASGQRWDARAGVTDGSPVRGRKMFSTARPPAQVQFVAGGGFTVVPGLRLGAGFAHGGYRRAIAASPTTGQVGTGNDEVTVFNVEGEFAARYTRLSGEWIADRFQTTGTPAVARGYTILAVQTLTPRWFTAARFSRVSSPQSTPAGRVTRIASASEVSAGYRLSRAITLHGGYQGSRAFSGAGWSHAAAMSIVWAQRWW